MAEPNQPVITIEGVQFDEKELKLISMSKDYTERLGAFGAPDHMLMVVVSKLARLVESKTTFKTNWWHSKDVA